MPWLSDCISKDPSKSELFIVQEGSIAVLAKSGRDRYHQAVLTIDKGIVRSVDSPLDEVLDNEGFKWIVMALGVGIWTNSFAPPDTFQLERLRYGKIILVMEENSTGKMIWDQVIADFRRFFMPVVAGGFVHACSSSRTNLSSEEAFEASVLAQETRSLIQLTLP